jgi:hypothetical protein
MRQLIIKDRDVVRLIIIKVYLALNFTIARGLWVITCHSVSGTGRYGKMTNAWGQVVSVGINRHRAGDERALYERSS